MAEKLIKRGDVYWVDLPDSKGRELKELHPCLVISNDRQIIASPLITDDKIYSFQVSIKLKKYSVILVDQIQTIDRDKFQERIEVYPKD